MTDMFDWRQWLKPPEVKKPGYYWLRYLAEVPELVRVRSDEHGGLYILVALSEESPLESMSDGCAFYEADIPLDPNE